MRCLIALLRPSVTMRLTRYSVASAVLPGLLPPPTLELSAAPATLLPQPQLLEDPKVRPAALCTPPGGAGHSSGAGRPGTPPPRHPCPYPPAGCRSGCGQPDGAGGSRDWSRCCGPSASASAWPRPPTGASRSAPCWTRLHVRPRPVPASASGAGRHLE